MPQKLNVTKQQKFVLPSITIIIVGIGRYTCTKLPEIPPFPTLISKAFLEKTVESLD